MNGDYFLVRGRGLLGIKRMRHFLGIFIECQSKNDELYTYIKKSNKVIVWTAEKRNKLKSDAFEIDGASKEVCKSLLGKLKKCTIDIICTDGNYAYDQCIPRNIEHVISKSETCLTEKY